MPANAKKYYEAKEETMEKVIEIAKKNNLTFAQVALLLNDCQKDFINYYAEKEKESGQQL